MEDTKIIINGVGRAYDGEYVLDDRAFNTREWNWIKRISGYMPFTVQEGMAGGDPSVYIALAVIAMCREGKIDKQDGLRTAEVLEEAPFETGTIQVLFPQDAEDDPAPLASTSEPAPSSQSRPLENPASSGEPSKTSTDPSDKTPESTGTSESGTSPISRPVTLAS